MPESAMVAALGLPTQMEPVYRRVLPGSGQPLEQVAASMLVAPERLLDQLAPLMALEVVTVEDGVLHVLDPATATGRALAAQAADLGVAARELARIAEVLPVLSERRYTQPGNDQLIDGDVSTAVDVPGLITLWIREKRG